jgi:hypothetical protein
MSRSRLFILIDGEAAIGPYGRVAGRARQHAIQHVQQIIHDQIRAQTGQQFTQ